MNENAPIEARHLGKKSKTPQHYDPDLLVAVPRILNREQYNINDSLFVGFDVWHAYEIGFLTKKGFPVGGLIKLVYPSNSKFLVESKSLKLYFNSFNMSRFGEDSTDAIQTVLQIVKDDLSQLLDTDVRVAFYDDESDSVFDFEGYEIIEKTVNVDDIDIVDYQENPTLLGKEKSVEEVQTIASHLLRSNCKITFQPDWGSVFIYIKGDYHVNKESLLKYIVSLRNENHFHEEITEVLYKRLQELLAPKELCVTCIYTRRGGIDITPVRCSEEALFPKNLFNEEILTKKLLKQ